MIRPALARAAPDLPLLESIPLRDFASFSQAGARLGGRAGLALGGLGLALAAIGLFGLAAQTVASRVREVAIRMAMGATSAEILSMILREGGKLSLGGVSLGLLGAIAATPLSATLAPGTDRGSDGLRGRIRLRGRGHHGRHGRSGLARLPHRAGPGVESQLIVRSRLSASSAVLLALAATAIPSLASGLPETLGAEVRRNRVMLESMPASPFVDGERPRLKGLLDDTEAFLKADRIGPALETLSSAAPGVIALARAGSGGTTRARVRASTSTRSQRNGRRWVAPSRPTGADSSVSRRAGRTRSPVRSRSKRSGRSTSTTR